MSKMDGLRAMREARYQAAQSRAAQPTQAKAKQPAPTGTPRKATGNTEKAAPDDELCGHRNMSGRTCTRERGHAAKSHRYS